MTSDRPNALDAWSLSVDHACTVWRSIATTSKSQPAELVVPAGLLTRTAVSQSAWATMATRGSNAPAVYLGLVGLVQLVLQANEEARYDEQRLEWASVKPRGAQSLETLLGFRGSRGHEAMVVAMRRLLEIGLVRLPRLGARGFADWRRFDILNPDGTPFVVPRPWARKPAGYNEPIFIAAPIGLWTNGWLLDLAVKEIEALLALLYQRERAPSRDPGRGWFVSTEQRHLLCLDTKTFGKSHRRLAERGVLTPVDPDGYLESKTRRGRGRLTDRPHEFTINLDIFNRRCLNPNGTSKESTPSATELG